MQKQLTQKGKHNEMRKEQCTEKKSNENTEYKIYNAEGIYVKEIEAHMNKIIGSANIIIRSISK